MKTRGEREARLVDVVRGDDYVVDVVWIFVFVYVVVFIFVLCWILRIFDDLVWFGCLLNWGEVVRVVVDDEDVVIERFGVVELRVGDVVDVILYLCSVDFDG